MPRCDLFLGSSFLNDRQERFESLATIISSWCRSPTESVSVNHEVDADATYPAPNDKSSIIFVTKHRKSNSGMFRRVVVRFSE